MKCHVDSGQGCMVAHGADGTCVVCRNCSKVIYQSQLSEECPADNPLPPREPLRDSGEPLSLTRLGSISAETIDPLCLSDGEGASEPMPGDVARLLDEFFGRETASRRDGSYVHTFYHPEEKARQEKIRDLLGPHVSVTMTLERDVSPLDSIEASYIRHGDKLRVVRTFSGPRDEVEAALARLREAGLLDD